MYTLLNTQRMLNYRRQMPVGPIQYIEVAEQASLTPYEQISSNRKTITELIKLDPIESQVCTITI